VLLTRRRLALSLVSAFTAHHVGARSAVTAAAPPVQRETIALLLLIATRLRCSRLRGRSGDERRQALDVVTLRAIGLLLRLTIVVIGLTILTVVTLLPIMARLPVVMTRLEVALVRLIALFARLLLLIRLGRRVRLVVRLRIVVAVQAVLVRFALLERLILPELFLRRGDQAEVMFGVLIVILGRHRIAGGRRITRKLDVLFGDVIRGTADFHIRPVGFVNPCQRIVVLTAAAAAAVTTAHPMLVLTVSHGLPVDNS